MIELDPALKWAGGKRWLAPKIRSLLKRDDMLIHSHNGGKQLRRYVEPFCGGLGSALGVNSQLVSINDANKHLIYFYWHLAMPGGFKIDTIQMSNDSETFYRNRERFNELTKLDRADCKEASELFYYLNRTCFNGLCRFNKKGGFNVPFGKYATIDYKTDFTQYSHRMENWSISCVDFELMPVSGQIDFMYCDPPYDTDFTEYSAGGFNWKDQIRLMNWLDSFDGPVIVSNQATDRIMELYKQHGFTLQTLSAPRRISRTGDRTPALEVFATRGIVKP